MRPFAPPPSTSRLALAAAVALTAGTLAAAVSFPASALEEDGAAWLHVAVDEASPRGASVRVNLPLALVEAALALIPQAEARKVTIAFDGADVSLAELATAWRRLGPRSGTLLTVDEPRLRTVVSRRGGFLVVDSHDRRRGGERVVVRIAAPVVDALLAGPGDRLDLAAAVRALAAAGAGEITADSDDGHRVRIWVDRVAEPRPRSGR